MNAKPRPCINKDLNYIAIVVRSMKIELLIANPNPCGHQTSKQRYGIMTTLVTRIIIQGIAIIIVKNMDKFLRIVLGHTSEVITKGG